MTDPRSLQTHVLGTGEDALAYDVRGDLADARTDRPALMIIGSPMDASGFASLAGQFTDRTVVTYDPRGTGRNPRGTSDVTPEQHAADLHRVIEALDAGPVDVFASSGGAVNALLLAQTHPEDLRVLVAHEPPTFVLLPDREMALAAVEDIKSTYQRAGSGAAIAKFVALVMVDGELGADYLERPAPDPAQFGMPVEDDGNREDPLMRNLPTVNTYEPDPEALAALGSRLVIGIGADSGQQLAARGGRSVAAAVGVPVTEFPGGHDGFVGGEYGDRQGDPATFAATLRAVLG